MEPQWKRYENVQRGVFAKFSRYCSGYALCVPDEDALAWVWDDGRAQVRPRTNSKFTPVEVELAGEELKRYLETLVRMGV
jgi:hypothetical protein